MMPKPESNSFVFFTKMCDELVQHAIDNDPELLEGIRWLDSKAQKEGITYYEMVFRTLYKHGKGLAYNTGRMSNMTCEQCKDLSDYVQHIFIMNGTYRCENCGRPYE